MTVRALPHLGCSQIAGDRAEGHTLAVMLRHGIDIVDVPRIAQMRQEHGQQFLDRCFTPDEQVYALSQKKRVDEHLAARFAAKEAVMKALGTGLSGGVAWTQIEVIRAGTGAPNIALTGRAAEIAAELGVAQWALSLSHTESTAMASVIAT